MLQYKCPYRKHEGGEDLFEKLRVTRESNNVTCEQLSHVLGLKTRGAYHKKENGLVPFTLSEAKIIADYFGGRVEDIFFDDEVS